MRLNFLNIVTWLEGHQLPCLIKRIFHVECPGCGIQRSFIAIMKGQFLESLKLYPPLIPTMLFLITIIINDKFNLFKSDRMIKIGVPSIFLIILVSYLLKLNTNL
jgi:Protein of unknown function (DUF2752)